VENINFNGVHISILKYKVRIFDPENKISEEQAVSIVSYLFKEGFISKQEFPVEIVGTEE
jgi:hypothetical protein